MSAEYMRGNPRCPVCGQGGGPLLDLPGQAIYQHPVAADAVVPQPHKIDLSWVACGTCAHGWQPRFDAAVLESIYRNFYYTPAPDGIAMTFREEFLAAMEEFGIAGRRSVLLEVGASSGDLLAELRARTLASKAYAFEPNKTNAEVARARGLDVREEFFSPRAALDGIREADLIYARHVIEHVFDFHDFFAAVHAVAGASTDLLLETPSLDFHVEHGSLDPFHVEHVHVFSQRSLARLASMHGWGLQRAKVTSHGNLIAWFKAGQSALHNPMPPLEGLQRKVAHRRSELISLFAPRWLTFWGAGSSGISLVNATGREPELWTDGNPNKVGKKFVGLSGVIVEPQLAIAAANEARSKPAAVVITSAFAEEILPVVRRLGWAGEVFNTSGAIL